MGFSTPKTPFNLADFLSQKGTPRSSRKPTWKRRMPTSATESETNADDASEEVVETAPDSPTPAE